MFNNIGVIDRIIRLILAGALVAGLAGEPNYLTVKKGSTLHPWGLVDNCTH